MFRHARHFITGTAGFVILFVPALLIDPAARSILGNHPGIALYLSAAVGVAHALVKAIAPGDGR